MDKSQLNNGVMFCSLKVDLLQGVQVEKQRTQNDFRLFYLDQNQQGLPDMNLNVFQFK